MPKKSSTNSGPLCPECGHRSSIVLRTDGGDRLRLCLLCNNGLETEERAVRVIYNFKLPKSVQKIAEYHRSILNTVITPSDTKFIKGVGDVFGDQTGGSSG
jgi:hypothetical protein